MIVLDSEERRYLEKCASGRRTPARLVLRAKIILLAAGGTENVARRNGRSAYHRDVPLLYLFSIVTVSEPRSRLPGAPPTNAVALPPAY